MPGPILRFPGIASDSLQKGMVLLHNERYRDTGSRRRVRPSDRSFAGCKTAEEREHADKNAKLTC